jgi:bifunctional UDP-N-acetylglucosamine pyrophosphorylase/glucosamine-1-phosphate N-acetyltransferase
MAIPEFAIAIMAAGKGTRLKSRRAKVLHEIGGRSLLRHVIDAAAQVVSAGSIYVITGHQAEVVEATVGPTGVHFVRQPEQLGTGHAIQCLQKSLEGKNVPEHLIVLSGDTPLIDPATIAGLLDFHLASHAAMTLLTGVPENPTGYGRVVRAENNTDEVAEIVEQKSLTMSQLAQPDLISEINSGIYAFQTAKLFSQLGKLSAKNSAGEYYLTDVAALLVAAGEKVVALRAANIDEVLGANTIAEMMHLDATLRLKTAEKLMALGVSIFRPETCVIDAGVTVGADTIIEPFVQLLGETRIGEGCRLRSYSVVQDSVLGNDVLVRNGCILTGAEVGDSATLGPYAHLRPESRIGEKAHVGNFVETKKISLGNGSKANHLTYLGDAVIGSGVNIGAGAITCNYDGKKKHLTTIEDGVFVGSDSTLVAPITIGEGAYIAAGSTITKDVPPGALALGRSQQTTKPAWVAKRNDCKTDEK